MTQRMYIRRAALITRTSLAFLLSVIILELSSPSFAQNTSTGATGGAPRTLSYQGMVIDGEKPVSDGSHQITVTLYADDKGAMAVWSSVYTTETKAGVFNVLLGSGEKALPDAAAMDKPLWVGVKMDNTNEMRPLTQLSASPYAINVPDNSITSNKMATDFVGAISLNGQSLTGKGTPLNIVTGKGLDVSFDEETRSLMFNTTNRTAGKGAKSQVGPGDPIAFWDVSGGVAYNSGVVGTATTQVLHAGTTSGLPFYAAVNLASDVGTSVLQVANGGTGGNGIASGAWLLGGNGISALQTLGSTAGSANWSEIVGGATVEQFQSTGATTPNLIGGNGSNAIIGYTVGTLGPAAHSSGIGAGGSTGLPNMIVGPNDFSFIGGGEDNQITSAFNGVNNEGTPWHFIGGGRNNRILVDVVGRTESGTMGSDALAGGQNNIIAGQWGFIGGGQDNLISNASPTVDDDQGDQLQHDVIAGGHGNQILAASGYSNISGGAGHHILNGGGDAVGGGNNNRIDGSAGSSGTFGGVSESVIAGGEGNTISTTALNLASKYAAIGGGGYNEVHAPFSSIDGGWNNKIFATAAFGGSSSIGGGNQNEIDNAPMGTIGGGNNNVISAANIHVSAGTIPGGSNLNVISFAQSALGFWNNVGSTFIAQDWQCPSKSAAWDGRLFTIGNGCGTDSRSNAFEVSYNGHSVVYDVNGDNSNNRLPVEGASYDDNIIAAWCVVTATPPGPWVPGPAIPVPTANDFGVQKVEWVGDGIYNVTLNQRQIASSNIGATENLKKGAVSVTPMQGCTMAASSPVANGTFTITITDPQAPQTNDCRVVNGRGFMFMVVGRSK